MPLIRIFLLYSPAHIQCTIIPWPSTLVVEPVIPIPKYCGQNSMPRKKVPLAEATYLLFYYLYQGDIVEKAGVIFLWVIHISHT